MKYASVCDGIGAVHAAWSLLGLECVWTSEIEPFPCAIVEHHWHLPNLGDMTQITESDLEQYGPVDILVGGTPCQSFSVAGLRKGLDDPRGNLALRFVQLVGVLRPRWVLWENVPGVLSSSGGRDFGAFLGALGKLGYGFAYRVLDAQFFGVAQRRRRVFVVGHLGDWRRAAAVLFERDCLSGNPPPSREAGPGTTHATSPCIGASGRGFDRAGETRGQDPVIATFQNTGQGWWNERDTAATIRDGDGKGGGESRKANLVAFDARNGVETGNVTVPLQAHHAGTSLNTQPLIAFDCKQSGEGGEVSPPLRALNHDKSHANAGSQVAVCFDWQKGNDVNNPRPSTMNTQEEKSLTLGSTRTPAVAYRDDRGRGNDRASEDVTYPLHGAKGQSEQQVVAFQTRIARNGRGQPKEIADALTSCEGGTHADSKPHVAGSFGVRRLTPMECERLQGFPDGYTLIDYRGKPAADGPRYRALGNAMAVPVMRWIGDRILEAESLRAFMEANDGP